MRWGGGGSSSTSVGASGNDTGVGVAVTESVFIDNVPANTTLPVASYASTFREDAFDRLNIMRAAAGLGCVVQESALDVASQAHSDFIFINDNGANVGVYSHIEDPNLPGFTGITSTDRGRAAGYQGSVGEVLAGAVSATTLTTVGTLMEGLISAIYHRNAMLKFTLDRIGVGFVDVGASGSTHSLVINLGTNRGQGAPNLTSAPKTHNTVWPTPGSTVWTIGAPEVPDPVP